MPLLSLGLIKHVNSWHDELISDLTLLVKEETFASKMIVCNAGEVSVAAYKVLRGVLNIVTIDLTTSVPFFTEGMWVGEKALVNPDLKRSATVTTNSLTTLMVVPAAGFHNLLEQYSLKDRFDKFCEAHIWKGLCGRCGLLGDHFSHECPLIGGRSRNGMFYVGLWLNNLTKACSRDLEDEPEEDIGNVRGMVTRRLSFRHAAESFLTMCRYNSQEYYDSEDGGPVMMRTNSIAGCDRSLCGFLQAQKLDRVTPTLQRLGVRTISDLKVLDLNALKRDFEADGGENLVDRDLRALSPANIRSFERHVRRASSAVVQHRPSVQTDHLLFLSHYKLEAGTEAALIRAELEHLMSLDPRSISKSFETPIFLDSEDLQDLNVLQDRVLRSHNVVLLLTKGVLSRPWVLMEIVTAVSAGIRVLPVEVLKPGSSFVYPNEAFFQSLAEGRIFDRGDAQLLNDSDISLDEVEHALRHVFQRIAVPYSPHRAKNIRYAELQSLLAMMQLRNMRGRRAAKETAATAPQSSTLRSSTSRSSISRSDVSRSNTFGKASMSTTSMQS